MSVKLIVAVKGSAKSGNYGHRGRPGKRGGSSGGGRGGGVSGAAAVKSDALKSNASVQKYIGKEGDPGVKISDSTNSWSEYSTFERKFGDGSEQSISVYHKNADGTYEARVLGKPAKGAQSYSSRATWGASPGHKTPDAAIKGAIDKAKKRASFKPASEKPVSKPRELSAMDKFKLSDPDTFKASNPQLPWND